MWSRFLRAFEGDPRRSETAIAVLTRTVPIALLILMGVTWPLWLPRSDFPQVPFVRALVSTPAWIDWAALVTLGLATLALLAFGARRRGARCALVAWALAIGTLVLLDQHRLQPWVYQFVVLEIVLIGLPATEAIAVSRALVASLYFYSALSKLDWSFLHLGGGQIVEGLVRFAHLSGPIEPRDSMRWAIGIAGAELLLAIGLCWRRSRRFAWPTSIGLHLVLLAALGPWGAQNKPGVLLWNAYFIIQNVVLFGIAGEWRQADATARSSSSLPWSENLVCVLAVLVMLFPLSEPLSLCDVWPAWAVYAASPERLRIYIDPADRDRLPAGMRDFVQPPRFEDGRCLVRIDRWSLETTGAPIYPQNRFRLGVALAIVASAGLDERIFVEIDSRADRFSGERSTRRLEGRAAIAAELNWYWLNGFPLPPREQRRLPGH